MNRAGFPVNESLAPIIPVGVGMGKGVSFVGDMDVEREYTSIEPPARPENASE